MELVRKLTLTSILALIAPGSAGQVVVGLLMAFVTLLLSVRMRPYAAHALNGVSSATQISLFFVLLVALLLKVNVDGEGDARFFSGIVGALCLVPVCMPVALRLYARFGGEGSEARAIVRENDWEE